MPNWCLNSLDITGPETDLNALLAQAAPSSDTPHNASSQKNDTSSETDELSTDELFSLDCLLPMPDGLLQSGGWYDWHIEHWGTKWDLVQVTLTHKPGEATLTFLSAWDPPLAALESISRDYPSLRLTIDYEDEGGYFRGMERFERGECRRRRFWKR